MTLNGVLDQSQIGYVFKIRIPGIEIFTEKDDSVLFDRTAEDLGGSRIIRKQLIFSSNELEVNYLYKLLPNILKAKCIP